MPFAEQISLESRYLLHNNIWSYHKPMLALVLEWLQAVCVRAVMGERAAQTDYQPPHAPRGQDHVDKSLRH